MEKREKESNFFGDEKFKVAGKKGGVWVGGGGGSFARGVCGTLRSRASSGII